MTDVWWWKHGVAMVTFFLVSHASRKKGYWNIFDGSYCETFVV